jgi:hypothetical protein
VFRVQHGVLRSREAASPVASPAERPEAARVFEVVGLNPDMLRGSLTAERRPAAAVGFAQALAMRPN